MSQLRAIETVYGGCRFRSRLEARWAVFFDALGIEWQYEPEGFELLDGARYLPDFYLPGFHWPDARGVRGLWVEVKPKGVRAPKAKAFAIGAETRVLLCDGEPGSRVYWLFDNVLWGQPGEEGPCCGFGCDSCPADGESGYCCSNCCFMAKYLPGGSHAEEHRLYVNPGLEREDGSIDEDYLGRSVIAAIQAARSARFEFGECGDHGFRKYALRSPT